jgi:hypothetical protein
MQMLLRFSPAVCTSVSRGTIRFSRSKLGIARKREIDRSTLRDGLLLDRSEGNRLQKMKASAHSAREHPEAQFEGL